MGVPTDHPEAVLVARLDAQVAALVAGTNLFRGPERAPNPGAGMPSLAVFVELYGGRLWPDMGSTAGDDRFFKCQVRIRGDVDGRAEAITLGNACHQACNRVNPSEAGYVWLQSKEPGLTSLGLDPTGHPRFSFNVELTFSG